jgi:hypothetical protein
MFAVTLYRTPRKLKQFINIFRLKAYIANQLALFDDGENAKPRLTFEQLGKFVAISLTWPKLITDLLVDPLLLEKLEQAAITTASSAYISRAPDDAKPEETPLLGARLSDWLKLPQLVALLQYGCVENPTWPPNSSCYSFQGVDLVPMLEISPQVVVEPRKKVRPPSDIAEETLGESSVTSAVRSSRTDTRKRFSGHTILWVDDQLRMTQEIVDRLRCEGAVIEQALTTEGGLKRFRQLLTFA